MRPDKNYYQILELDQNSDSDQIKHAYRRLALKYHPDRNPGDSSSEEQFKLISEAYAVLIDSEKRRQYNQTLRSGYESGTGPETGFSFNREDIFREFFASAHARQAFRDLGREFKKSGYRFDEQLFRRLFPGNRGFYIKGYFFTGPMFGRARSNYQYKEPAGARPQTQPHRSVRMGSDSPGILDRVWRRINKSIKQRKKSLISTTATLDINYNLTVTKDQIGSASKVQLLYERDGKPQKVSVKIPAGIKDGARLRLKKMGHHYSQGGSGDLYIHIRVSS